MRERESAREREADRYTEKHTEREIERERERESWKTMDSNLISAATREQWRVTQMAALCRDTPSSRHWGEGVKTQGKPSGVR